MAQKRIIYRKIGIDTVCIVILGLAVLFLYLFAKPFRRGFFCDDESIRHPYPKYVTVPDLVVALVGVFVPVIAIISTEIITNGLVASSSYVILRRTLPVWIVRCYSTIGAFLAGVGFNQMTVDVGKNYIGRLRPHFISVCVPNIMPSCQDNNHNYHTEYICQGPNPDVIEEARLSFPSGHAALSFYCATFLVMYLQRNFTWEGSVLLRHIIQFILLLTAWFTALSRVTDYMHHWSDVLAGGLIGALIAVLTVLFVSDIFKRGRTGSNQEMMTLVTNPVTVYVPNNKDEENFTS